jgi:ribosomal protein S18 acetylase RimI-like enzyme
MTDLVRSSNANDTSRDERLTIRLLMPHDDLASAGAITVESYHALAGHPPDAAYDDQLSDVAGRVASSSVIGAFASDQLLGCVTYVAGRSDPFAEDLRAGEASFRMLAVAVAAQGRGVGKALVRSCLDRSVRDGNAAVFIYSGSWMTGAHGLYERMGFERRPDRDLVVEEPPITLLGYLYDLVGE